MAFKAETWILQARAGDIIQNKWIYITRPLGSKTAHLKMSLNWVSQFKT